MREALFLKQHSAKWKDYETALQNGSLSADALAACFVELTDDLSYARTFYPKSKTVSYLNGLAAQFHIHIYKNKKEKQGRIVWFWQFELPYLFKQYHLQFLYAGIFFIVFCLAGALSAKYDDSFIRLILGDSYVNQTLDNIENGDPFKIYKSTSELPMFLMIASNNIYVSLYTFVLGITCSIGVLWSLMNNGLMLGSFQYFFISKGLGTKFILVVFIHGTLEIWSLIIAGAAGLIVGNSILFPGTYTRMQSLVKAAKNALKIVIGLIPMFIIAAILESFVTRHTEMPLWLSVGILTTSAVFIVWYFIYYPIQLHRTIQALSQQQYPTPTSNHHKNIIKWISNR